MNPILISWQLLLCKIIFFISLSVCFSPLNISLMIFETSSTFQIMAVFLIYLLPTGRYPIKWVYFEVRKYFPPSHPLKTQPLLYIVFTCSLFPYFFWHCMVYRTEYIVETDILSLLTCLGKFHLIPYFSQISYWMEMTYFIYFIGCWNDYLWYIIIYKIRNAPTY